LTVNNTTQKGLVRGVAPGTVTVSGTYSWSTNPTTSKVSVSNAGGENATITAISASASRNDVTIQVIYTYNTISSNPAAKSITVQKPSYLRFVRQDFSGPTAVADCNPGTSGWKRDITWQVMDHLSPAQSIQFAGMQAADSITFPSPNDCQIIGAQTGSRATFSDGTFPDHYFMCSPVCPSRNCLVNLTQTWTANGISISSVAVGYGCTGITVNGQ
jgi:hypothetical protein